ncbi:peptidylprolyl isomerase [Flavobacterium sp.]|uniref:peptidylprolyl isomerase n=2 Tax=Flavobacterium sp. TaxID=239 RepID=UPI0040483253
MKYIKNKIFITLLFLTSSLMIAQPKKVKVDGVVAVVGDYVVLDSDIDLDYITLKAQGVDVSQITRCELFGMQLENKLYAHQAIQDSIVVTDAEVNSFLNEQLDAAVEQIGSIDKVVKYYNKKNVEELRSHFFDAVKMNKLTSQMRNKIIEGVSITPEEVRTFFNSIPKDEIPTFGAEMEVAQIVIKPVITEEEKKRVIDKLNEIRQDVLNGSSFYSKAVLFTEDEASVGSGGFYKINRKTSFVKEFKDVAFSLAEGEISEPFETEFGYHIIKVEKIKGQEVELRHILISPKVSTQAMKDAREKIELIRNKIVNNEISFEEAAKSSSDQKETRNSGGVLLNPRTMEPRFELTKMDPTLYAQVSSLKDKEISLPILDEERGVGKFYKIITVNNRIEEHQADFSRDYLKIKELALKDKQVKEIAKWTEEKIKETYIKIAEDYKDCDFVNNWLKK